MRGNKSIEIERAIESGHAREASEAHLALRLSALLAPSLTPILELFLDYLACLSEDSCCTANIWFVFLFVGSCQAQPTHRVYYGLSAILLLHVTNLFTSSVMLYIFSLDTYLHTFTGLL